MAAGVGGSLLEWGPEHSARPARWAPAWGVLCPLSGEDVLLEVGGGGDGDVCWVCEARLAPCV